MVIYTLYTLIFTKYYAKCLSMFDTAITYFIGEYAKAYFSILCRVAYTSIFSLFCGFQFLHIFASSYYLLSYSHPNVCEVASHCGLDLHFSID